MDVNIMNIEKCNNLEPPSSPACKEKKKLFIKPFKQVLTDLQIVFLIHTVYMYGVLMLIPDPTISMAGNIWIGIAAWRGGIYAGLLACILTTISTYLGMYLPPNDHIPMLYVINHKVPGTVIGIIQGIICGFTVGYISTLVHRLRNEIYLREKTQKELVQKIAELDAFGRTVAHDLKNPLMVISMSISSLNKEFASSDNLNTKKKIAFINDGTKQMINIIESILMLAGVKKINRNEFTAYPISESVDEALKRMEYNIESTGALISKPDIWPTVVGFAPWITEVWVNYINNAIKYGGDSAMQKKPVIELGFDKPETTNSTINEHIRFWVKDNGQGIAKENVNTLFKEFTRLHSPEQEGHGLGLSIVKTVIDKFDGAVGVESEVGKGSLFYFTLPTKMYLKETDTLCQTTN